jgi:hypothetical protein
MNGYKTELFVGTFTGQILVIQNKTITKVYNICISHYASSIQIDDNGYMNIACYQETQTFLYQINGTYMKVSKLITSGTYGMKIDSKGRWITTSAKELNIYY